MNCGNMVTRKTPSLGFTHSSPADSSNASPSRGRSCFEAHDMPPLRLNFPLSGGSDAEAIRAAVDGAELGPPG